MYLWDNLFDVGVMRITVVVVVVVVPAQTEGDTGYDYNDAYEDSYDESSGQSVIVPPVAVQTIVHRTINYTVLQKNIHSFYHCNTFDYCQSIFKIFGRFMPQEICSKRIYNYLT